MKARASRLFLSVTQRIGAVLIAHVTGAESALTLWGASLYFWARLAYIPLYALGVPVVRSLVWMVSLVGLILIFAALFI